MDKIFSMKQNEFLFFDLEFVCQYDSSYSMRYGSSNSMKKENEKMYELFVEKIVEKKNNDNAVFDENDLYKKQAIFIPEFGKIICASFLKLSWNNDKQMFTKKENSFYCIGENALLTQVAQYLESVNPNVVLSGFNIVNCDIPYLVKRFMAHKIKIPKIIIDAVFVKPWDKKVQDYYEVLKLGSFNNSSSLDLSCLLLEIPSSKDGEVCGKNLNESYWMSKNKDKFLEKVKTYCEEDVRATAKIAIEVDKLIY